MKLIISLSKKLRSKLISFSLLAVALILLFALMHTATAGRLSISLNSPVSFPVDI